jgi:hypothetical protein
MNVRGSTKLVLMVGALVALTALAGCTARKTFEVSVAVDFGPAQRPEVATTVLVPEGSTVFDALRAAFAVATSGR